MVSTKSVYEPNEVIGLNTILKAHETVVSTKIGYDPENVKELGTTNMAEQTEKAFLKQPKVFLCSKKSGKGKRPGKGGNRYWKSIGLGFKTPREAIEDMRRGIQKFLHTYPHASVPRKEIILSLASAGHCQ
ncbi:unnamed protein product [Ilex paraguariensis]|uniref:Small ribosomal subunit protein uS17 N-terminal domain-containing protein n=1 Tax=Ilex paraguariensis TaxID=185542 RepID=A0ABC8V1R6_9AQUA